MVIIAQFNTTFTTVCDLNDKVLFRKNMYCNTIVVKTKDLCAAAWIKRFQFVNYC